MSGYTPLFDSLTTGTLCGKWPDIGLWGVILSLSDQRGVVDVTHHFIHVVSGLSIDDVKACMKRFCEPDPASRSQNDDGRRLELLDPGVRDWGWRVINKAKYREKARKQAYDSERTASGEGAERKRIERSSRDVPPRPAMSRDVPPSDTDTDSNTSDNPPTPQGGSSSDVNLAINRIFQHWRSTHDHPKAVLDKKRRALIRAAMQNYDEQTLKDAITGYRNSPHHTGVNERNTAYDSIEVMLRDAKHIDAGLKFFRQPPKGAPAKKETAQDVEWRVAIDAARKEGFMRDPKPGETVEQFREATKVFARADAERALQRFSKPETKGT
jgi:hypothetical protein